MGDEIMRMLENLVLKEARTFEILKKQYEAMLAELPKGSLTLKRGVYYYEFRCCCSSVNHIKIFI